MHGRSLVLRLNLFLGRARSVAHAAGVDFPRILHAAEATGRLEAGKKIVERKAYGTVLRVERFGSARRDGKDA